MRDAVAAAHPELLWAGAVALLIVVALLWTQRRSAAHPEEVGAAALLLFLVPVVPLRSHTYLYYLYLPWAGASWLIAAAGARLSRTWSHRHAVVAVLLVGLVALEFRNVRLRERTRVHGLLRDRTMRESELLRAAIHDLDAARLPAGSQVAIVDPTPPSYLSVADADTQLRASPRYRGAYRPLEGALRHGEALAVFVPGATLLGVDRSLPRAWEDAQIFWSKANGGLEPLGTGSLALAQLGEMNVSLGQWDEARRLYSRTRERGDTLAPSTLGLMVVEAATGHQDEAQRYAVEFLRRWPDDPRAAVVDSALRSRGSLRLRD
jgi:tetratricopeptide (TPR) repeat protein